MSHLSVSQPWTDTRRAFLQDGTGYVSDSVVAPLAEFSSRISRADVRPMRDPTRKLAEKEASDRRPFEKLSAASTSAALPPTGVLILNKLGFGPRPGDLDDFEALGADDNDRIENYVDLQLNPTSIDDSELEERLVKGGFTTLHETAEQAWQLHVTNSPSSAARYLPFSEMERAVFMRAIYSKRQLTEVLADFWHNHFNVYARDYWASPHWGHYDRDVIRGNMLGNFRKMLEDVAKSVPMLYFLDNYTNTNAGPNENYARELFELHTLGAENYYGVIRQQEVPVDEKGNPKGYCDDDVYEATRCLTGWSVNSNTGGFQYSADKHDRFQKYVLRKFFPPDQPPTKDGLDVLDVLARHPGTARYIARKLCRRFIADDPPQRIVDEAAAVFLQNADAPDQLKKVVRVILLSPELRNTWGKKVRRPFEYVVSCLRSVNANITFTMNDNLTNYFMGEFSRTGQLPFQWSAPDGYPDRKEHWLGNNTFVMCWRLINWLVDVKNWWSGAFKPFDAIADTPRTSRTAESIADFWIYRLLGRPLDDASRQHIVDFMAAGRNPQMELPIEQNELLRERVWGMVALILMSPQNLLR